jgi:signal transduction histidine kinase
MRRMAESLLELARLDGGQEPLEHAPLDLASVARETVEMLGPLAQEKGIELRTHLESVPLLGDRELLGRVITNLVTNAIHYNREKGEVMVSTRSEKGKAVLAVSDTGIGMTMDEVAHIF